MNTTIKTMTSVAILSIALTSSSSAGGVGTIIKECVKKGCVQKGAKVVKEFFSKSKDKIQKNPIKSGIGIYGAGTNLASAGEYLFGDEEEIEITTINNESNETLDLLKMEP